MKFHYSKATPMHFNISNTTSEKENPECIKHFGVLLENKKDVVLDYKGEHIEFQGDMTPFALINCENVVIENLSFTFAHPNVTEMTVAETNDQYTDFEVHEQSDYVITNGCLSWRGENFSFSDGLTQCCYKDRTWRMKPDMFKIMRLGAVWEELSPKIIRANAKIEGLKRGMVLQTRDTFRTEVGVLISGCKNVTLRNVRIGYAPGLCIVAQNSEDITLDNIVCRPDNGRTTCAFADFVQISGCKGKVTIQNSFFSGAHDDAINVHGTHLIITEKQGNALTLRFMHPQTYNIGGFLVGETVCDVKCDTLQRSAFTQVQDVKVLNEYELLVMVDNADGYEVGDAVENYSRNPEVVIQNNWFEHIPTRGILLTTAGKSLIKGNMFYKTYMQAIEVSDDAKGWYESGAVNDVTITENTFLKCGQPVIRVLPQNSTEGFVHENIRVINNEFVIDPETLVLSAKATRGIVFHENRFDNTYKAQYDYSTNENGEFLKQITHGRGGV